MAVQHSPESEYAKEMVKWEAQGSSLGPGLRPYVKHDFPWRVYKAGRVDNQLAIIDSMEVGSEHQLTAARSRGFFEDPLAAFKAVEASELEIAKLAANRAYGEQHMSNKAKAEVAAVEADTSGHLPSMPVTPIRRRVSRRQV